MASTVGGVQVNAIDTMKFVTLEVRIVGRKRAYLRLVIAAMLLKIARWVGGFAEIRIKNEDE